MKTFKKTVAIFLFLLLVTFSEKSFSQNVLTFLPETNGEVLAIAVKGDTAFIGGGFTTVGGLSRKYLAGINIKTGFVLNWNLNLDQAVKSLVICNNIVYAAGYVASIGGQNRTAIAAIDITTGNVTNWNPIITCSFNYRSVDAVVYADNKLFISGYFDNINGQAIPPINQAGVHFAVLDATTGQLVNWFSLNGFIYTALVNNNILYVGGNFNSIGGQSRPFLSANNLSSNIINSWNPNPNGKINKIIMNNGGIYAGGNFGIMGAGFKNGLAYIDTLTGLPGNWNPLPSGSSVYDMTLSGNDMYVIRNNIILENYDINNGTKTDSWFPNNKMMAIASSGNTVIVGGQFTKVGWVNRNYLFAVTRGLSLGINEVNNFIQKISVFPNPATNKISFSLNETNNKTLNIIITNILGETVFNNTLNYQKEIEIPVTDLKSGIYFIKIQSGNNTYAGKFVKE